MDTPVPAGRTPTGGGDNPVSPAEPQALGDYRLLRRIGEGGMGSVYLGFKPQDQEQVALKVLAPHLASDRQYVDRFYREARFGSALNHLNIVRTKAVARDPATGWHYMVLEYVDGPSCQFLLDRTGPLAVADASHVALAMAQALQHMHRRGFVHRDIKPDNILITTSGVCKLADFGLVKRLADTGELTAANTGFGTSWYMPFEQTRNASFVDGRSDIFALGATIYHLLTGAVPFAGDSHREVTTKKETGEFVPASRLNPAVPKALDLILARMLARDPRKRYQSAARLVRGLEESQLSAPLLSFINTDLALQDPAMRDRVEIAGQATSPDLRPDAETPRPPATDIWHLRYHDKAGRLRGRRASTRQVLDGLRRGLWPDDTEAARSEKRLYRPLRVYPEFRDALAEEPPPDPENGTAKLTRRRWQIFWCAGLSVGAFITASLMSLCRAAW